MWWIILGWLVASFIVAVIFGHAARRDEGTEERFVVANDSARVDRRPVLH